MEGATAMAKQPTPCAQCGGTFDGTPSGWRRHYDSTKHQAVLPADPLEAQSDEREPEDTASAVEAQMREDAGVVAFNGPNGMPQLALPWRKDENGRMSYQSPELQDAIQAKYSERHAATAFISEAEAVLKKRTSDHRWQTKHRTAEQAEAYRLAKVVAQQEHIAKGNARLESIQAELDALLEEARKPVAEFYAALYQQVQQVVNAAITVQHQAPEDFRIVDNDTYGMEICIQGEHSGVRVAYPAMKYGDEAGFERADVGWFSTTTSDLNRVAKLAVMLRAGVAVADHVNQVFGV